MQWMKFLSNEAFATSGPEDSGGDTPFGDTPDDDDGDGEAQVHLQAYPHLSAFEKAGLPFKSVTFR